MIDLKEHPELSSIIIKANFCWKTEMIILDTLNKLASSVYINSASDAWREFLVTSCRKVNEDYFEYHSRFFEYCYNHNLDGEKLAKQHLVSLQEDESNE